MKKTFLYKFSTLLSFPLLLALISIIPSLLMAQQFNQKIRVLNYNIKGTPGIVGGNSKEKLKKIRDAIREQVNNGTAPDVIMFQEVFSGDAKKAIRSLNEDGYYPYMVLGPGADGFSYSSGLTTLSKIPVITHSKISYGSQNCSSSDCYANKGAHLVILKSDGWPQPIVVVNTHLQATKEYEVSRINQMKILSRFVSEELLKLEASYDKVSVIIGGDLNTKPDRNSYSVFKSLFPDFMNVGEYCLAGSNSCSIHSNTTPDLLLTNTKDHQFFRNSKKLTIKPVNFVRNFSTEVDNLELSDHKGYQVDYNLSWK